MAIVTMKQLLETGVHFGHRTRDWHPEMGEYIFTSRNKIHIINLEKTVEKVKEAYSFVRDMVAGGGNILFVCTKRQGGKIITEEAKRCGMFYVDYRWWGGMLTNFSTISKSIDRLRELEKQQEDGVFGNLSKKEQSRLMKEKYRLERGLSGIKDMNGLPDIIYVVDIDLEEIAIAEATKLNIPVVALVDTNCTPRNVDYVIPGNDDAIQSIKLITSIIADAAIEGRALRREAADEAEEKVEEQAAAKEKASSKKSEANEKEKASSKNLEAEEEKVQKKEPEKDSTQEEKKKKEEDKNTAKGEEK